MHNLELLITEQDINEVIRILNQLYVAEGAVPQYVLRENSDPDFFEDTLMLLTPFMTSTLLNAHMLVYSLTEDGRKLAIRLRDKRAWHRACETRRDASSATDNDREDELTKRCKFFEGAADTLLLD